jgi:dTDP-4-amino-4,6-dideoxygalactose transaminase
VFLYCGSHLSGHNSNFNEVIEYEKMNIPFSPPDVSELEIQYVSDAMRSGWITTGPRTKLLEEKLATWVGTSKMVCLNSQTAAAETSLRVLGIGEGDEVITCAYTYTASASVAIHVGAKVVLVDCSMNPDSLEMDYDALEAAITEKTKVIVPVDLGGIPCDYDRIYEIVERKKALFHPANKIQEAIGHVVVVSDAAHALGASYHGKMVGTLADFTNYSLHEDKFQTVKMTTQHIVCG